MEARIMLTLDQDEVLEKIPYMLICETYCRDLFRTGKAKRLRADYFTADEWDRCLELCRMAYKWALRTGVPEKVVMSARTLALWIKLGEYCAAL